MTNPTLLNFDAPKNQSSIIKVIGVGGGGSNAVNYMYNQGIEGVDFVICNTDSQALELSPIPNKIQIGVNLTEGRGAGSLPAVGKNAAIENIDEIRAILENNTKMLFITAGLGGGTGTGAAPVIAALAREMDILTVAIVTIPFAFEGRKRRQQAEEGVQELRKYVDTLIMICNDKMRELYGNLRFTEAFAKADNILATAAKGIAEIITVPNDYVNVDFADVKTVMKDSGVALMGSGIAEGEGRALKAIEMALSSPLLNDNDIRGAKNILLNITSGTDEISMDEVTEITDHIQHEAGVNTEADIIFGIGRDASLGKSISISLVATGFGSNPEIMFSPLSETTRQKKVHNLEIQNKPIEVETKTMNEVDDFKLIEKKPAEKTELPLLTLIKNEEEKKVEKANQKEFVEKKRFAEQLSFETDEILNNNLSQPVVEKEKPKEKIVHTLDLNNLDEKKDSDEQGIAYKTHDERIAALRRISINLKNPNVNLEEFEKIPAFVRRQVELSPVIPSNESQISRYNLVEDTDKKVELRPNNFLHDNVD